MISKLTSYLPHKFALGLSVLVSQALSFGRTRLGLRLRPSLRLLDGPAGAGVRVL